ncbi:gliding motility-associated C-terminal domain-containing protein [Flavobacterium sp. DG1-102-2]|uniref:T9SS type B sorting domain-containing protein n=1 Tax=Flavobacterium sp. DG1-102-2 TaxID=3081663 RepID=UPI00294A75DE|nr:gliding motility-associated C-terminal domain-containing protein [Flavobacterium sp. DG1-102-2]MDV6168109.1 gliding motility-associated C-terminal domain-containing protein [Flavobacterium sp. DG1-102-2]
MKKILLLLFTFLTASLAYPQVDIALYQQFNGRYDFTFVGNTLNEHPNGPTGLNGAFAPCELLPSSSAQLSLASGNIIEKAYLYWAGSGTGDFEVKLNGTAITAERDFAMLYESIENGENVERHFFSAFADVTALVLAQGNGTYTFSDMDLSDVINGGAPSENLYCRTGVSFGGWTLVIVYKNNSLALNQLNVYDGFQMVPNSINITLDNLNVIDNAGSKIGFVAWEGDANISVNESLKINNLTVSNPPLNPSANAFNGTNSITGSSALYNMDLDIYTLDNFVAIGDTTAEVSLQSGQDVVIVNCIVTKLNSELPDATITIDDEFKDCAAQTLQVDYTVHNDNSTAPLPAGTQVTVYYNGDVLTSFFTQTEIAINGSESGTLPLPLPTGLTGEVQLIFIVDDNGTGTGSVIEIDEQNNSFTYTTILWALDPIDPADITHCETASGTNVGIFDFSGYEESLKTDDNQIVTFYHTLTGAQSEDAADQITAANAYLTTQNPETVFVRLDDPNGCSTVASFELIAIDCTFPDATVTIGNIVTSCDSRTLQVTYTVNNFDSSDILPANTPVAIYANGILIATAATTADIAIGGSLTTTITVTIPAAVPQTFNLTIVADDTGNGTGVVIETNELNNGTTQSFMLWVSPVLIQPAAIEGCETFNGSGIGVFDFSIYAETLEVTSTDVVTFHTSQADADSGDNPIDPVDYNAPHNTEVYVRLTDENGCYDTASFTLFIIDCYFPDATVVIDDVYKQCNSRILHIHYTVSNVNGTDVLPANTPVAIYADGQVLTVVHTINALEIGESEPGFIEVTVPIGIPLDFELKLVADDTGNGMGIVLELNETNNEFAQAENLPLSPVLIQPDDIELCDAGFGSATFDFSDYAETLKNYPNETVTFYTSQANADQDLDRIYNITSYSINENPTRIYVRLFNGTCHTTASFLLKVKKCAPVTHNYVTPNGDGLNDDFFVEGLRNVFLNFKMSIYNRWGTLIWTGNHSTADWDATADVSKIGAEGTQVPVGTYYFVLELNDPDFAEPIVGWVYVTR